MSFGRLRRESEGPFDLPITQDGDNEQNRLLSIGSFGVPLQNTLRHSTSNRRSTAVFMKNAGFGGDSTASVWKKK